LHFEKVADESKRDRDEPNNQLQRTALCAAAATGPFGGFSLLYKSTSCVVS
jgi:hypothetical protein